MNLQNSEALLQVVDRIINLIRYAWLPLFLYWLVNKYPEEIRAFINRVVELNIFGNKVTTGPTQSNEPSKDEKPALEEVEKAEKVSNTPTKVDEDDEKLMFLKNYIFEVAYRQIYGSQINILLELESNQNNWFSGAGLILHYMRAGWTYEKYPFVKYMDFLITKIMIEYRPSPNPVEEPLGYYKLSNFGKEFLEYLRRNNIPLSKDN